VVRLTLVSERDLGVEAHAVEEKSGLFKKVFGRRVAIGTSRVRRAV
jgi:hypothetical protein